ncbi:MAG: hypothetical protein ABEJ83_03000 [Candidatus Nanohaloarchaea archaeon]
MESVKHALISTLFAPLFIYYLFPELTSISFSLLLIYAVATGVLIDLDHFLITLIRDKDLKELKNALENPKLILTDNEAVFDQTIPEKARWTSHTIVLILVPLLIFTQSPKLGVLTFLVLDLHIAADAYQFLREHDFHI